MYCTGTGRIAEEMITGVNSRKNIESAPTGQGTAKRSTGHRLEDSWRIDFANAMPWYGLLDE